jgi:catechol 2,3-dioxygenase-like lactoylglutathione lyase family enzyme
MHIRQIALVARDLEPAVADLCAVLGVAVGFRDPGVAEFGLRNAVMPVGTTFLEVVSPARDDTTAGRFLARRGGDGGYMVILQTDDLAAARARLARHGARVVWEATLDDIATVHVHPRDVGGAIVSIDQPRPPASWRWAGPGWERSVRTDVVRRIVGVEIEAPDPPRTAARWAELLGLSAPHAHGDGATVALDGGVLRFAPAGTRGEGLAALDVAAVASDVALATARARGLPVRGRSVSVCGVRIDLV